jgi:hypothetical protein
MRLLDAEADDAGWREVARIVLHIDSTLELDRARLALSRVIWLAQSGRRATATVICSAAAGRRVGNECSLKQAWPDVQSRKHMAILSGRMNATINCHNCLLQFFIRCVAYWGEESMMSGFDWRSGEAYPDAKKAETVDIDWEWLRRDRKYQRDYKALVSDQRSSGTTDGFRQQWGLSFRG